MINRKELARHISKDTGYYIADVEAVLESMENIIPQLMDGKNEKIKLGKLMQFELETIPKKTVYDGLNKRYVDLPERYKYSMYPLKKMMDAIDSINENGF